MSKGDVCLFVRECDDSLLVKSTITSFFLPLTVSLSLNSISDGFRYPEHQNLLQ